MNEEITEKTKKVLLNFSTEMNQWETSVEKRWSEYDKYVEKCNEQGLGEEDILDDDWSLWMQEYLIIFRKFCSKAAEPRGRHVSTPPSYDPDRVRIFSIEKWTKNKKKINRVLLKTYYHDYPLNDLAYEIILEDGEWKILKRYYWNRSEDSLLDSEI